MYRMTGKNRVKSSQQSLMDSPLMSGGTFLTEPGLNFTDQLEEVPGTPAEVIDSNGGSFLGGIFSVHDSKDLYLTDINQLNQFIWLDSFGRWAKYRTAVRIVWSEVTFVCWMEFDQTWWSSG